MIILLSLNYGRDIVPCLDGKVLRKRLLTALIFYESQSTRGGRLLHPKRREDIANLTSIIHTVIDDSLLEYEVTRYLGTIVTGGYHYLGLFQFSRPSSYLRDVLMQIISDENRKFTNIMVSMYNVFFILILNIDTKRA